MRRTAKHRSWTLLFTWILSLMLAATFATPALADDSSAQGPSGTDITIDDPDAALEELFSTEQGVNALQDLLAEAGKNSDQTAASGLASSSDDELTAMDDGAEPVGRLKILARYNDDMQFYDGHVYLLFTSYQDGVTFTVNDIYGAYGIADQYYKDIAADISNGSNHTGSDAEKYFTFDNSLSTMTLNRGEIVTVGMYRGFDLSVPQAALGSIQNSTLWSQLSKESKTAIVKTLFDLVNLSDISTEDAVDSIQAVLAEYGSDINYLLDGVVEGGVCFNRELYNQKLEWDQYENVTYEIDITQAQLDKMALYLTGNLNKFSILKNSCATVALRAWNAVAGEENQIVPDASGIYQYIDAPKSVRDAIRDTFEGREDYHLNNAEGGDPEAGYTDETGWVYVSAPEPVEPVTFTYAGENLQIDADQSAMGDLLTAAKQDKDIWYHKDHQEIPVSFDTATQGDVTTIKSVSFDVNGTVVSLDEGSELPDGIWFKVKVDAADGASCYATDGEGNVLPSSYSDGWLSFQADALPASYQIVSSDEGARNLLATTIVNGDKIQGTTKVYYLEGGQQKELGAKAEVPSGTKVYIKSELNDDWDYMLTGITFNGASVLDAAHYDETEGAYVVTMPESYSKLVITYETAYVISYNKALPGASLLQVQVGDTLDVKDYAQLYVADDEGDQDLLCWGIMYNNGDVLSYGDSDQHTVVAQNEGTAVMRASARGNKAISVLYVVEVYSSLDDMATITYPEENVAINVVEDDGELWEITFSGYKVEKGTHIVVETTQDDGTVISSLTSNGVAVAPHEEIVVNEDTEIAIEFAKASIEGMPTRIDLAASGDTYQLQAKVRYDGLINQFRTVYDPSITYESSSDLVTVDETGLITVNGEVPEGGKAVIVTAYAGSSNRSLYAQTKVVVGDYEGDRIVGRLTVHARRIDDGELIAHASATFTTYQDIDLDVSYYAYYEPTSQYKRLMEDYRDHPENYEHDPALCNDNELGLENRESYFIEHINGAESEPETISMRCGESITLSNYSFDPSNLYTIAEVFARGDMADSASVQELARQAGLYAAGSDDFDGEKAFDSLLASFTQMVVATQETGQNPANGHTIGGIMVNRELYNQFRRNDSQLPNSFYTVEITADELAALEAYLADPSHNYYSFFTMNCGTGSAVIWNTTLADRPELQVSPSYTGIASDPESLYFELVRLTLETGKYYDAEVEHDWGGGYDFYPRTVACPNASQTEWVRLAGKDRYATMELIVQEGFEASDAAVLVTGDNFPDALAASSLAGKYACPVVLTKGKALSTQAKSELQRLGVKKVYIVGGTGSVSKAVADEVAKFAEVERIAGTSRQGTSLEVTKAIAGDKLDTVVICSGVKKVKNGKETNFADALSIGPWCYATSTPIVLTGNDKLLTKEQVEALKALGVNNIVIVGGPASVDDGVAAQLGLDVDDSKQVLRLAGNDRYETSALIAFYERLKGMEMTNVAVATGATFPDALAGAALCGANNSVLILAKDTESMGLQMIDEYASIKTGYVLGGENSVSAELFAYLEGLTK